MSITVIIADDHAIFRQGLVPLLEGETSIELVAQAANGADAWKLIESLKPDVAILDVSMPDITGLDVARRVEAAKLDTRIVLLTMHDDPSAALEAEEAGVAGYVLKENSFEDLLLAVKTVAAGGTFLTSSLRAKLRALARTGHPAMALSPRERDVIGMIAQGHSSKEIARRMGLSPRTVDTYRNRLMRKLDLHCLADVVRYAIMARILPGDQVR
ncbi:response regulator [Methylolobus aquaticus]